jgi:ribonuclease J
MIEFRCRCIREDVLAKIINKMKKTDKLSKWLTETITGGKKPKVGFSKKKPASAINKTKIKNHKPRPAKSGFKKQAPRKAPASNKPIHKNVTRVIPVGGLEEVGKNTTIIEHGKDIVVVDMGFEFPEDELFGVDYVVPDVQYLVQRKDRIRGIVITHGHLDHIGALPYVLAELGNPVVYSAKLTIGLIQKHLEKNGYKGARLKVIDPDRTYEFGSISVDFFRVNHSIPDSFGLHIKTPEGNLVHTGDFKFDFTPADGVEADIGKISKIGRGGVDLLLSDSTNATEPGHTMSEQVVAESLERTIADANGRIIIACFSSLIGRIQNIVDFAMKHNRHVFLSGRSIETNVAVALELGYIKAPKDLFRSVKQVKNYPDHKILILTTGSQGEPMAALSRMAAGAHSQVKIRGGDTVVVSASPIIGNEKAVAFLVDGLARLGAHIVHNGIMDVHTTGHGKQEDLKMMMSLVKPRYLIPVHGNYYMRKAHAGLAPQAGIASENTFLVDNGGVIELRKGKVSVSLEQVEVRHVVIDGMSKGDVESHVLKERESMAQGGFVQVVLRAKRGRIVGSPLVEFHGFVYQKEAEKVLRGLEKHVSGSVKTLLKKNPNACGTDFENFVRSDVSGYIRKKMDRRPLVSVLVVTV